VLLLPADSLAETGLDTLNLSRKGPSATTLAGAAKSQATVAVRGPVRLTT